jgi:Lrp/AsnC family transcriptional regulator for asnA, asnC and gidA
VDKTNLDTLDNKIIRLLTENGRMSMGEMAKKLNVTSPTIRNRIKDLEKNGIFKVSGLIDPNQHPQMTTALVAMSIRSHGKMDQVLKKIDYRRGCLCGGKGRIISLYHEYDS